MIPMAVMGYRIKKQAKAFQVKYQGAKRAPAWTLPKKVTYDKSFIVHCLWKYVFGKTA